MRNKKPKTSAATKALIKSFFQLYPDEAAKNLNNLETEEILRLIKDEPTPVAVSIFERLDADICTGLIDKVEDEFFRELFSAVDPSFGASTSTLSNRLRSVPSGRTISTSLMRISPMVAFLFLMTELCRCGNCRKIWSDS